MFCPCDSSLWLVSKSYGLFDLVERDSIPTSTAGTRTSSSGNHATPLTSWILSNSAIVYLMFLYNKEKLWLHIQALVNQGTQ